LKILKLLYENEKNHSPQTRTFLPLVEAVFSENDAEKHAAQNPDTDFAHSPRRPLQFELSRLR